MCVGESEEMPSIEIKTVSLNEEAAEGVTINEVDEIESEHESNDNTSDDNDDSSDSDEDDVNTDDMLYYERAVEEIRQGDSYSCMICTVEMDYQCQMYACNHCYRVFDYDCIREWALKSTERTLDKIWKCPNCSHVNRKVPVKNRATCWCGKVVNPDRNELNPNSCGQTCNAPTCAHGCSKVCHLGPHPECTRMLTIQCNCGKSTKDIPCYQSKSRRGKHRYQCEEECGLLLPCGIHKCKKKCHSGLCGACPEVLHADKEKGIEIKCYCGLHDEESIKCKDVIVQNSSKLPKNSMGETWIGVYACNEIRTVDYSCHNHSFVEACVSPPSIAGQKMCPFSPSLLKTCPCGKTPLATLANPRTKCTDPIPVCESSCDKKLKCGKHTCPFTCHDGPCMDPCVQIDRIKCDCEQSSFLIPCQFEEKPHCNLKCESLMSCRRHRCTKRCCSGRPAAEKRKKTLFRTSDIADETLVEPEHVCVLDCNLMLSCGTHRCQRKCHPGKCPPCLESDSNDLVCLCGKTIVEAPVRCGTKLPPCLYPCIKVVRGESDCGHTPAAHTCHPESQPCPPCTASVFKPCKCGKNEMVRTVCFQTDVSCGKICGKTLVNCYHTCQKKCHLPGECQTKCKQVCKHKRVNCEHICTWPCHGKTDCPDTPCIGIVKVNCPCGRREIELVCGATLADASESDTEVLPCDEECEILKRHQQLKFAFGIMDESSPSGELNEIELEKLKSLASVALTFEDLQLPYVEATLVTYSRQPKWCAQIEDILNKLLADRERTSLHFKPMKAPQRHFITGLAKSYKLYAESQDRDPKRSVFVKKSAETIKPSLTLEDASPLYQLYKQSEKERKQKEFEARTTTRFINVPIDLDDIRMHVANHNGFVVNNLAKGVTIEDLEKMFAIHMKPTLISDPQYSIKEKGDYRSALIYPKEYSTVSENVERDLETLVGHFNFMVNEEFIADSVELCNIDDELTDERLATPGIESEMEIDQDAKLDVSSDPEIKDTI